MSGLNVNQFKRINDWMQMNARPVDLAKWNYLFNKGSKDDIVSEMLKYQNSDGGFGNGFESDILLPLSAAIPSAEAIFTAYNYDLDCNALWFKQVLSYFENTIQDTPSFWECVPKEIEDYPHAPWWIYKPDASFSPNPCAVIASAMILHGTDHQKEIGNHIARACIEFLCSNETCGDHDTFNLIRLVESLQKINSPLLNDNVISSMKRRIMENVCFDDSKWMEYVAQPLDMVDHPNSFWFELVSKGVKNNFNFWLNHLNNEGVWTPNFSWGTDNETSRKVTKDWTGYLAVKRARIFNNFGFINIS